jgi:hypothetical protein
MRDPYREEVHGEPECKMSAEQQLSPTKVKLSATVR